MSIILASTSPYRRLILENAGIEFTAEGADVDERMVEKPLLASGATPEDIAIVLAEAKALDVSARHADAYVIGCDQTLSLGDEILHKSADMEDARRKLLSLSGKTHHLNSAIVIVRNGETIWRHVCVASMTMRELTPGFIGRYLAAVGETVLGSVGAYAIEGRGIQLFDKVDGDHFTIIGLPLLPLLAELRSIGEIDG